MMYPSDELMDQWRKDAVRQHLHEQAIGWNLIKKACDWQKERDAEICFKRADSLREEGLTLFEDAARGCGEAIRGQRNE